MKAAKEGGNEFEARRKEEERAITRNVLAPERRRNGAGPPSEVAARQPTGLDLAVLEKRIKSAIRACLGSIPQQASGQLTGAATVQGLDAAHDPGHVLYLPSVWQLDRETSMKLSDARAIVTGAAGGLGGTFALELAREGALVAAGDTNAAGLRKLSARAAGMPGRIFVAKLDITDEESVSSFIATAAEEMGGLNVLINSAGIARDGLLISQAEDGELKRLPLAQWRKVMDVNLTGQFLMAREFAAHLVQTTAKNDGRDATDAVIVNLSSIARAGNPGQSNYAASKAGLDACTRTWALELARYGIRVGGVAPGVTETGFLEGFSEEALARLRAGIPLGRLGKPEEIWRAVRFILEDDFFTGRTVEIDGGAAMGVL